MSYIPRIADNELRYRLESFGAVLIEGPKWCGKTTTATQEAKSILYMEDPDTREEALATASVKPSLLLIGENPRLIDEWQVAPVIWDAVRASVDKRNEDGLYILTGSNSVKKENIFHSGTGRISRMRMTTMTLKESGESTGEISLHKMFSDDKPDIDGIKSRLTIEELVFAACRGGWPGSLRKKTDRAKLAVASDYIRSLCEMDISTIDGVDRNPTWTRAILSSYARNVSTLAKNNNIFQDVYQNLNSMSQGTFDSYKNALERLFVIKDLDAWCPSVRSKSAIRAGKKHEFTDPSIAIAALGVKPEYFYRDMKTFGFIFECLCARDLQVYSYALGGRLSHYRDRYGLESDFVLHLDDGRYALIECKLGSAEIDEGAKHLVELHNLIKRQNETETQVPLREPELKIVLTGGEIAYRRSDDVYVIPIGCLGD